MPKHFSFACAALLGFLANSAFADVVISNSPTQNMACSLGVCAPTSTDAVLNVADLEVLLQSGPTRITTTGAGVQANDIVIGNAITWKSANSLTLDAGQSILIESAVSVGNHAGVTLVANDGGTDGVLSFGNRGHLQFSTLSSALVIDGVTYTLVPDIQTLATDATANPGGNFALAAPYTEAKHLVWSNAPILKPFTGRFDGLGNTVRGFAVSVRNPATNVALFSTLAGGTLSHIRLLSVKLDETGESAFRTAILVGTAESGTLFETSVKGKISASYGFIGGLVGTNYATIISANADVKITARQTGAGGLVEENYGTITQSHASGTITGRTYMGGLVVFNLQTGSITLSSASVDVTLLGSDKYYSQNGGLVGENQGVIDQCFATGNVSGALSGGLVGVYDGKSIIDSYATGNASGDKAGVNVGGLLGGAQNGGEIQNVYSTGAVSTLNQQAFLGGLVGRDWDERQVFSNSYWDTDSSGISNPSQGAGTPPNDPGIAGLSSAQLQSGLPVGFSPAIWAQNPAINNGFPFLIAKPPQ